MHKRAFTLIELLVVIAVIAVLMSVLFPALKSAKDQARTTVCRANLKSYGLAGTLYMAENDQRFPNAQRWLYDIGARPSFPVGGMTQDPRPTGRCGPTWGTWMFTCVRCFMCCRAA